MLVAYVSIDEVHQDVAFQLAKQEGVALHPQQDSGLVTDRGSDAIIYDLDFLPLESRHQILAKLEGRRSSIPVAVHGFNLDVNHKRSMRRNGVVCSPRLDAHLFRLIKRRSRELAKEQGDAWAENFSSY
jgi:hypothetical protein